MMPIHDPLPLRAPAGTNATPSRHRTRRRLGAFLAASSLIGGLLVATGAPAVAAVPTEGLKLHYDFTQTSGATVTDVSGNGRNGTVVGAPDWTGASLRLSGAGSNGNVVKLPDNLLAGASAATIVVETKPTAATLSRSNFLWNIGGTSTAAAAGTGSWFASPNGTIRSVITPNGWGGEQSATWTGNTLTANVWQSVAATISANADGTTSTITLYINGVQRAQNTAANTKLSSLSNHLNNLLGGSAYAGDASYAGEFAELRVYDVALNAAGVAEIATADAASTAASVIASVNPGALSSLAADVVLPSSVTWASSNAGVISPAGVITRPAFGQPEATATLTATANVRGAVQTRDFPVSVRPLAEGETALPSTATLAGRYRLNAGSLDASTGTGGSMGGLVSPAWRETHLDLLNGAYQANGTFTGFTLGSASASFSFDVKVDATATGNANQTLFTYGSNATNTHISYRPFWTATSSAAILRVNSVNVAVAEIPRPQVKGQWVNYTIVLDDTADTFTVYENGVQAAQATGVTAVATAVGNGVFRLNRDATNFVNVPTSYRDVSVYRSAVTAGEASALARVNAEWAWQQTVAGINLGDLNAVTQNLALPGAPVVTWTSSNPAVISNTGVVTRPAAGQPAAQVTLTASSTRGGLAVSKTYAATVPAEYTAEQKAQFDLDALALTGVQANDVRNSFAVPNKGTLHGSPVTWTTSDPSVVTFTDGVNASVETVDFRRPAYGADPRPVTLTAKIQAGATELTRDFPLTVTPKPRDVPGEGYAFAYFTGDSVAGEQIYFSASVGNNIYDWKALNGGNPVLSSQQGERGLRDPFIIQSPDGDKYYMIATDLSIGRNGDWGRAQQSGSQYIEIWESTDLTHWSDQRHVKVSPETVGMTWAPEAYWVEETQEYIVFWSSRQYTDANRTTCISAQTGGCYAVLMYATTKDFRVFSEPQVWQDSKRSRIDSTVMKGEDGFYYRFTKTEATQFGAQKDVFVERSKNIFAPLAYTDQDVINRTANSWCDAGSSADTWCVVSIQLWNTADGRDAARWVEGPSIIRSNPGDVGVQAKGFDDEAYVLFVDDFGGPGYLPLLSNSISATQWSYKGTMNLNGGPKIRHGSAVSMPKVLHNAMTGTGSVTVGTTTTLSVADGAVVAPGSSLTVSVAAADGYEVGGKVGLTIGGRDLTAPIAENAGAYTATFTVPTDIAGAGTPVTARYLGYRELTESSASVSVNVQAPATVSATTSTRCVAGKVVLTVNVTNNAATAADVTLTSAYGTKAIAALRPGQSVSHAFTTRLATMPNGVVQVGVANGAGVTAAYAAASCAG